MQSLSKCSNIAESPAVAAASSSASGVAGDDLFPLVVLPYNEFMRKDSSAIQNLRNALLTQGIVGIKGIPGYRQLVENYMKAAYTFAHLADEVKERYAPIKADPKDPEAENKPKDFLGYTIGEEMFKGPDGKEIPDDSKASYYFKVPDIAQNKWPREVDLKTAALDLSTKMNEMGQLVMEAIGLLRGGPESFKTLDDTQVARMLFYGLNLNANPDNEEWCGRHRDHGAFTVLAPAVFMLHGQQIAEPSESGLFVQGTGETQFRKVVTTDPDTLYFQVGEAGQIVMNDRIFATPHLVRRSHDPRIERYTMALFYAPPWNEPMRSRSVLTLDTRFTGNKESTPMPKDGKIEENTCSYGNWHERSMDRYKVKKKDKEVAKD